VSIASSDHRKGARALLRVDAWLTKRGRVALGFAVCLLIIVHGFWPHTFRLDGYTLALVGVLVILALHPLLRSAKVAGIGSVEFRDELRAGEATAQRIEAQAKVSAADNGDRRSIRDVHALFDIPEHLRELADYDPNVALVGLRIELERAVRRVFAVLYPEDETRPLTRMIRALRDRRRIDDEQANLAFAIIRVGNRAAHGEYVTPDDAQEVFSWADTLNHSFGVGYSLNFAPNLDFEDQGLVCEFEHCIENMPLRNESDDACPMWGHDCPGGRRRVATCPAAEAWRAETAQRSDESVRSTDPD
jgi:Domain of unknown function (DUF4145)